MTCKYHSRPDSSGVPKNARYINYIVQMSRTSVNINLSFNPRKGPAGSSVYDFISSATVLHSNLLKKSNIPVQQL